MKNTTRHFFNWACGIQFSVLLFVFIFTISCGQDETNIQSPQHRRLTSTETLNHLQDSTFLAGKELTTSYDKKPVLTNGKAVWMNLKRDAPSISFMIDISAKSITSNNHLYYQENI